MRDGELRPEASRIADIEVLRAISVLMVLVQHTPFNLVFWNNHFFNQVLASMGLWTGVDIFFAISGFVIARSLMPEIGVRNGLEFIERVIKFWIRRVWRLWPSAWLWLIVPIFLCLLYNRSGVFGSLQGNWEGFIAGILNLANFRMAQLYGGPHPVGVAFVQWSLSLEEQFYFILPLAVFVFRRWLPAPLLLIAGMEFVLYPTPLVMSLRLGPVALGVLLAIWSRTPSYQLCEPRGLASNRLARTLTLAIPLVCLVSLGTDWMHIVWFRNGPIEVMAVFLVWIGSYNRDYLWSEGTSRRLLEWIASRSYSLYLVHISFYFGMHETWFRLMGAAQPPRKFVAITYVLIGWAMVFLAADLNHRFVERPLRQRGKKIAAHFGIEKIAALA